MKLLRIVGAAVTMLSIMATSAFGQTWTPLKNKPSFNAGNALLLTDGTVFVQDADNSNWWKLTPDNTGNYINGTWTQLASTSGYGPLYYASQVLPDGRVFVMGGEYNFGSSVWTNKGAIYTPSTNSWVTQAAPSGWSQMGDTGSLVLNNGMLYLADPLSSQGALFNPATNTFVVPYGTGKADGNDEEGLTLLPNGNILTVDAVDRPNSEIFNTATATWSSAGNTPSLLADPNTEEIGPAVLRPDGTIMYFGALGANCIFNTATSTWSNAPSFPTYKGSPLDCEDAPAVLEPSGNVLVQASPGVFNSPSFFFEWNGSTLNQLSGGPSSAGGDPSYTGTFLLLPSGQILWTSQNNDVEVVTPTGSPNPAWAPTITSSPSSVTAGSSYTISGTQFNGLSGGSAYGDDEQNETNYPIIRITNNSSGHVYYCTEFNPSTMAICTGSTVVSTNFTVPSSVEVGASTLQVVTNGIPSAGVAVTVSGSTAVSITSLSPTSASAGTSFTLTVNGSGFANGATVNWNGSALATTFVSGSQLTAKVTNTQTATAGTYPITVTVGGTTSNSVNFNVNNPSPTLNSVTPNSIAAGSGDTTITLGGYGFVTTSSVLLNGSAISTTYVSGGKLTAVVPAANLSSAGTLTVQVKNPTPGGGTSAKQTITVTSSLSISSISPTSSAVGASLTLTVNGGGFVSGSVVDFNGVALSTTFVSATQVTAQVTSTNTASAGSFPVTVVNPGNVVSNAVNFTVNGPPSITTISPSSGSVNTSFTLTVNGSGFLSGATVEFNGSALSTTFVSASQLTAQVTTTNTANAGSFPITVVNPDSQVSNAVNITISNATTPNITSISPTSGTVGVSLTLTVNGSNFVSGATVDWNGSALATTFVSSTQLTAKVTQAQTASTGTYAVTVVNPGNVVSNSVNFQVNNPSPTLNSVTPNSIAVGSGDTTITLAGYGFVTTSSVLINGSAVSTTYVSGGKLTAVVPASLLSSAGSITVQVKNPAPGGGTSAKLTITVH